ncbi:MAG: hypothetical protein SYC29_16320 [Planctomycetota bacterium]|jgi:hypothetical protein|nr:hypothetical protein [Planctomycetota bacterium]
MITNDHRTPVLLAICLAGICSSILHAGITEYDDKDEWEAAAGSWSTADFTGFEMGTPIDEQYAYLGVHFVDGYDFVLCCDYETFPQDGAGLDGNEYVDLVFDAPMSSIAADFPGAIGFDLYFEGEPFYTSSEFGGGGLGNFGGLVSTVPFDRAVIWQYGTHPNVTLDDLHFGPPIPAPSPFCIISAALLAPRRRRT